MTTTTKPDQKLLGMLLVLIIRDVDYVTPGKNRVNVMEIIRKNDAAPSETVAALNYLEQHYLIVFEDDNAHIRVRLAAICKAALDGIEK